MKVHLEVTGKHMAAGAVVALAGVLALAQTAARGGDAGAVNAAAAARAMLDESDHVTATELARWLTEKRGDYQLVDLRLPWQYDDYHIPTAVSIPLAQLFEQAGLEQLQRGKKIVVYGLGAGHAAEAQLLLQMKGYRALSLKEGISAWWNDVLTPQSLRSESAAPAGYQQAKRLRESFLGGPATSGGKPAASGAADVSEPPSPAPAAPAGKKLKLGRGCS